MLSLSRRLGEEVALVMPSGVVTRIKVIDLSDDWCLARVVGHNISLILDCRPLEEITLPTSGIGSGATGSGELVVKILVNEITYQKARFGFAAPPEILIYRTPEMENLVSDKSRERRGLLEKKE